MGSVAKDLSGEAVGRVRLGLPTTVAGGVIPRLVPSLEARHPHIRLHVVEAMSGVLSEQLQLGKLDLAVLYDIHPMAGLETEPILKEKLCLLVPQGHDLARRDRVTLEEVTRLRLILPGAAHSIRSHIESYCRAEGLTLDVAADIDSLPGLFGLVEAGRCTILPTFLIAMFARPECIVAIDIVRPAMEWTLHLASRLDAQRPLASTATGRVLKEICVELVQTGVWPGAIVRQANRSVVTI